MAYFEEEFDNPSSIEYYLMQLTAAVDRGNVKRPAQVKMQHYKLRRATAPSKVHQETITALAKAQWMARCNAPGPRPA